MLGDEDDTATIEKPDVDAGADDNSAIEAEAREQGWRSKEEYQKLVDEKGADPKKWIDAKAFLEKGANSGPILRDQNRKLTAEMKEMKALVRDVLANQKESNDRAVRDALAKLNSEKRAAVEEADPVKVAAIDTQIDKLKEGTKEKPVEKEAPGLPEEFARWGNANPWFKTDSTLRGLAIGHFDLLTAEDPDMSDADKLKAVKAEVMRRYPERFSNPARRNAVAVEGSNGTQRNGNGKKTWADLPPDVKDIAERLVRQKVVTKEQYLQNYQWS